MKLHPLLTKSEDGTLLNKHYDNGKETTIEEMERIFPISKMIGWAEVTIFKYQKREKGQNESDLVKIAAYTRYKDELNKIDPQYHSMSPYNYWGMAGIEWVFKV